MGVVSTSKLEEKKMYPGMIISYQVSPVLGLKMTWVTEITQVKEREYFVDEQRVGPYKLWHHEHKIAPLEKGIIMYDLVSYQPPMGIVGALANSVIIKNKLNTIFDYRRKVLDELFGEIY